MNVNMKATSGIVRSLHPGRRLAIDVCRHFTFLLPLAFIGMSQGLIGHNLAYGIGGSMVTVAVLSLALNLVLTGAFIYLVKRLLAGVTHFQPSPGGAGPFGNSQASPANVRTVDPRSTVGMSRQLKRHD